jgi:4-hydroxyphenylpyruvate dioxygenase
MRHGIATVCLSGTLEDKLTAAAHAGFDGVEIFEPDLIGSRLSPEEVGARAAGLGLSIDLYQPVRDFDAVAPEQLSDNLRRAEAKFDVMRRLGATTVLVCSNVSEDAIDDDALAAEQLHLLAERAAGHGIQVAYEALAWGRHARAGSRWRTSPPACSTPATRDRSRSRSSTTSSDRPIRTGWRSMRAGRC